MHTHIYIYVCLGGGGGGTLLFLNIKDVVYKYIFAKHKIAILCNYILQTYTFSIISHRA